MRLLFLITTLLATPAFAECIYNPDGKVTNAPCYETRVTAFTNPEQWAKLNELLPLVSYDRVSSVQAVCDGAKACRIDGRYHVTHGDIAALARLY